MKFFSIDHLLQFSWDQVVAAYWQRYPNPKSKHVLTEDVLEREIVGHRLITKRLITKTNPVPSWARRILTGPNPSAVVVEESIVDLKTKQFTTYTRNITMQDICQVDEKCIYTQHPENQEQTACVRQEWISYLYKFANGFINTRIANRMKKNSFNAFSGFEHTLHKLYIGEVPEVVKESMKERAKGYAKSKAESVKSKAESVKSKAEIMKSKVHIPNKTVCESPSEAPEEE